MKKNFERQLQKKKKLSLFDGIDVAISQVLTEYSTTFRELVDK